jgi:hypothetical protein
VASGFSSLLVVYFRNRNMIQTLSRKTEEKSIPSPAPALAQTPTVIPLLLILFGINMKYFLMEEFWDFVNYNLVLSFSKFGQIIIQVRKSSPR